MSNVVELSSREMCYDRASEWIAKLDRGLTPEERKALSRWMAADAENRAVFLKMAELWDKMDTLACLSDLFPRPPQRKEAAGFGMALAASVVVAVVAGLWGLTQFPAEHPVATDPAENLVAIAEDVYQTMTGEQSAVNLPDGSKLQLNTDSLARVRYSDKQRLILLERGELHIDVAHDESRPLRVVAAGRVVQAVGTAFNVEIRKDDLVELIVTDGKVLVGVQAGDGDGLASTPQGRLSAEPLAVSKDQMVLLGGAQEEVEQVDPDEINISLSWRSGNLVFRAERLEDAIAEINRYTQVEFIISDEKLKKMRVSGMFKAGDVTGLLEALEENFQIDYRRTVDGKILLNSQ